VDPVPDPLLLRKSGSAGNRTRDHIVAVINIQWVQLCYYVTGVQDLSRREKSRVGPTAESASDEEQGQLSSA
jgi:hypothetical protein